MKVLCNECMVNGEHPELEFKGAKWEIERARAKGGKWEIEDFIDLCYSCIFCGKTIRIHVECDEGELYISLLKLAKAATQEFKIRGRNVK